MNRLRPASVVVLLGVLAVGCGASAEPAAVVPPASQTTSHLVLTAAAHKPIVMIKGLVNGGRPLPVDLASFNALPVRTLTVVEPFVKESMTFTGVSFADVLTAAHATGNSVTLHALDDYEATLDAAVLREPGVLLATRVDGKAIDVSSGGPVRLIFPPSSAAGKDTDLWVWSIDEITVT